MIFAAIIVFALGGITGSAVTVKHDSVYEFTKENIVEKEAH